MYASKLLSESKSAGIVVIGYKGRKDHFSADELKEIQDALKAGEQWVWDADNLVKWVWQASFNLKGLGRSKDRFKKWTSDKVLGLKGGETITLIYGGQYNSIQSMTVN